MAEGKHELHVVPVGDRKQEVVLYCLVLIVECEVNGDVLHSQRCGVLDLMRKDLLKRDVSFGQVDDLLAICGHFEAEDEDGSSSGFRQEEPVLMVEIIERHVDISRANVGSTLISLNLQVLMVDIVEQSDELIFVEVEVEMIEQDAT